MISRRRSQPVLPERLQLLHIGARTEAPAGARENDHADLIGRCTLGEHPEVEPLHLHGPSVQPIRAAEREQRHTFSDRLLHHLTHVSTFRRVGLSLPGSKRHGSWRVPELLLTQLESRSTSSSVRPLSTEAGRSTTTSEPARAWSSRRLISSHCGLGPGRVSCRAKPPRSFSPRSTKTPWPRSSAAGQGTLPPCS